jgi:hypothetical protein
VRKSDKYGFIGHDGHNVVEPKFNYAQRFSGGLAAVAIHYTFGYIDKGGDFVIDPQFQSADSFSEGLALISLNRKAAYIRIVGTR